MSDTPPNPLEGLLNEFSLGPAWARAKQEPVETKFKHAAEREYKPRGGGDRRDESRGGGSRGNRDDRRGGTGGGRRDFDKGGRGRPDFQREEIAPAEGVTVTLVPEKTAIQLIIKEVHQVARVYPLFDVAEIILAERSRLRATFEVSEKKSPFFRCKLEEAIYLTKEEALRHLLDATWRDRFIAESTIEIDPPKGNFQSVARCGISGEWLGPPNFHTYQTEIRRIHRERFPNMPFEAYQSKIRTERGEEAVNAWLETMKTQTRWRILSEEESAAVAADSICQAQAPPSSENPESEASVEIPAEEVAAEISPAETQATELPSDESDESDTSDQSDQSDPSDESDESEQSDPLADEIKWFTDRAEFERALAAEVLEIAFHITRKAKVSAAIAGKNLSPGLLARLKGTGNHHRKHPAILIPVVCKILEAEHMPVFKRKGKLYTGPARPKPLAADAVLAPRPAEMVKWIRENPPAKLEGLWKAVLPEGATAPPAEYAADLFWLLQQGHILLYTDDTLVVQEVPKPQQPKKPKKPKEKKPAVAADSIRHAEEPAPPAADTPPAEPVSEEPSSPAEIISTAVSGMGKILAETAGQLLDAAIKSDPEEQTQPPAEDSTERPSEETQSPEPTPPEENSHPEPSSHNSPDMPEANPPLPPKEPEPSSPKENPAQDPLP